MDRTEVEAVAGYRCKRCGALTTDRYGGGDKCPVFPDDNGLRDFHDLEPVTLAPVERPIWNRSNEPAEVKRSERLSRARSPQGEDHEALERDTERLVEALRRIAYGLEYESSDSEDRYRAPRDNTWWGRIALEALAEFAPVSNTSKGGPEKR